ncbi:MAG: C25 family cysteine peptidase, partial [Candidatus Thermoplasmatota archaeon]|nr:C25 family cysteine peptidase [Candidatus Thermoplasmatota archaeon]
MELIKNRSIAAILSLAFIAISLSGCISDNHPHHHPGIVVEKPDSFSIQKIDFEKYASISLPESAYMAVPVLAPAEKIFGQNVTFGEGGNGAIMAEASDASLFSSQIALAFWEGSNSSAVVVDSYENALLASPLAVLLGAPLLYYGNTTNEALWRIGASGSRTISVGNIYYRVGMNLRNESQVWEAIADEASRQGLAIDYLAVANPADNRTSKFATPYISCFAPLFASENGGAVVLAGQDPNYARSKISNAMEVFARKQMPIKFICIMGDCYAVGQEYKSSKEYSGKEEWCDDDGPIPSDNYYASTDGNDFTLELSVGRVVGRNLSDICNYFYRMKDYNSTLSSKTYPADADIGSNVILGNDWNNNAITYHGVQTEYMSPDSELSAFQMFRNSKFDVQDDFLYSKLCGYPANALVWGFEDAPSGPYLAADFAKANFISVAMDHGCPEGTVTLWYDQLVPMNPCVYFIGSCHMGCIDKYFGAKIDKSKSFLYEMLSKGAATYIASTRLMMGSYDKLPSTPASEYEPRNGPGLNYLFFKYLIENNETVGEALMHAKNELVRLGYV